MNQLGKSLAVFNWASQRAVKDLTNTISKEKLQISYEIQEEIGRGAYGIVKKCERKSDKAMFAIKIILFKDPKLLADIEREMAMMRKLNHEKLVTLHESYESAGSIAMVMDYIAGGELFEKIIAKEYLTEKEAVCYLRQLLEGLAYMHSKSIVHLDIKPENILCVGTNSDHIKLIDFGLARELKPGEETRCALGTPDFVAPEAIAYNEIKPKTDMWSVGVLTYVLLSGLMPFGGDTDFETLSNISNVDWEFDEDSFYEISSDAQDFIENLLVLLPESRMSSSDALEHRWIYDNKQRDGKINTKRHRTFLARRRWKKSVHVVMAVTKLCRMLELSSGGRFSSHSSVEMSSSTSSSSRSSTGEVNNGDNVQGNYTPSSAVEKSENTGCASEVKDVPKDINSTVSAGNTPTSKQMDHAKKPEDEIFENVSLSNSNGGKITWKVLK